MQEQTLRQQARLRALRARAKLREEQLNNEWRLARWGEAVVVALGELDAAVADVSRVRAASQGELCGR